MIRRFYWLLIGLIFLSSPLALGVGLAVKKTDTGKIILTASNCDELKKEVMALWEWGRSISLSLEIPSLDCTEQPETTEYDITSLLDPKLQWIYDRPTVSSQANCCNNVLLMHRWTKRFRMSREEELTIYLNNSNYCREVKRSEALKPGDIVTINQFSLDLQRLLIVHTATVIDQLFCQKEGKEANKTCRFVTLNELLSSNSVPSDCDRALDPEKRCPVFTRYYRCKSGLQDPLFPNEPVYRLLDQLEFNLENVVVYGNAPLSHAKMASLLDQVNERLTQLPITSFETARLEAIALSIGDGVKGYEVMYEIWELSQKRDEILKNISGGFWRGDTASPIVDWIEKNRLDSVVRLAEKDPALFNSLVNLYSPSGERPLALAMRLKRSFRFLSIFMHLGAVI